MAPGSRRAASTALGMLSLTSFLLGAADAWAQQKQDVSVAEATLEEVVVTSRKVSENVQDVPLTVNVLTAEALTERGIVNLSQINGVASNVVWEDLSSTTRNRITIRGIASNDNSASFDPGIGVYVDDVYLASGLSFNSGLLDVDRIEILKGPQGTLSRSLLRWYYGRRQRRGLLELRCLSSF